MLTLPPQPPKRTERLAFRVDATMAATLKEEARRRGRTLSNFVVGLLSVALEQLEPKAKR